MLLRWWPPFALMLCLLLPAMRAVAHPHVFVEVGLRFSADAQGRFTGVEVTWVYDDFFSLLILTERGLDPDGDGHLTASEEAKLEGFDLENWPDWFEGDLYLHHGGGKLQLGPAKALSATVVNGRIVTRHRRAFGPVPGDGLKVSPFDPTYYVSHRLKGDVVLPEGCTGTVIPPDPDTAAREMQRLIDEAEVAPEKMFEVVQVGALHADRLEVSCAPGS